MPCPQPFRVHSDAFNFSDVLLESFLEVKTLALTASGFLLSADASFETEQPKRGTNEHEVIQMFPSTTAERSKGRKSSQKNYLTTYGIFHFISNLFTRDFQKPNVMNVLLAIFKHKPLFDYLHTPICSSDKMKVGFSMTDLVLFT